MQKAVIIYNDRVITFRKMREIDAVIDEKPTEKLVMELAELKNRNLMCFKELECFNKTGKWLNKHPLLSQFSQHTRYKEMLRRNPAQFLEEYSKTAYNVNRYRSYLNNSGRDAEKHESDQKNLDKHIAREKLMKEVLDEHNSKTNG